MRKTKRIALVALISIILSVASISYVMAECASCNNFKICDDKCESWTPMPGLNFSIRYVSTGNYWGCVSNPDFPEFSCTESGDPVYCGYTVTYDQPGCVGKRIGTGQQVKNMGVGDDCD
jgi:hypothetical protein